MSATHDALCLVGILAVVGVVSIIAREHFRPAAPRYGRESDEWGDQPDVSVFHNGTPFSTRRRNDHVSR